MMGLATHLVVVLKLLSVELVRCSHVLQFLLHVHDICFVRSFAVDKQHAGTNTEARVVEM